MEILHFMTVFIQSPVWKACWKVSHRIYEGENELQNIIYKVMVLEINLADDSMCSAVLLK